MTQVYGKVALIGLGLIASSMFWAMRRRGLSFKRWLLGNFE